MSNIFKFHRRTMKSSPTELTIGQAYKGGFYAGTMQNGSNPAYALIVCPRSNSVIGGSGFTAATTGDLTLPFGGSSIVQPSDGTVQPAGGVSGACYGSRWDGLTNTTNLYNASSTTYRAAAYCKAINVGGYTDWYLPAKDELELCYRSFKPTISANFTNGTYAGGWNDNSVPKFNQAYTTASTVLDGVTYPNGYPTQTSVTTFRSGGSEAFSTSTQYWTSCESSTSKAWRMLFVDGQMFGYNRTLDGSIRPVRRSLL